MTTSIEVLDKVIDEEAPVGEGIWTPGRVAIVSGVLQSLAFLSIQADGKTKSRVRAAYLRLLGRANIEIGSGGNLDLELAEKYNPTVSDSMAIVVSKSRALGDCMGRFGAMAAEAPRVVIDACGRFGGYAAGFAALVNDLHDARPGGEQKSDIRLKRKTPPITFLMTKTPEGEFHEAKVLLQKEGPLSVSEEAIVRQAIEASDALHFTTALADTFRYKARRALEEVREGVDIELLCRGILRWSS